MALLKESNIIVVDIDGTVCTINQDYFKCKLIKGVRSAFKKIRFKGYKIYLYTGRHINQHDTTVKWLKRNKVDYDLLIFGKPPARYYIDDRAIKFNSWSKVQKQIKQS